MMEKMKKYMEMVEALRAFGEELVDEYYDSETKGYDEFIEEVDCMGMHCECCVGILEDALK